MIFLFVIAGLDPAIHDVAAPAIGDAGREWNYALTMS
jgi:hypothetical protein